jgi:hypothetical protein
VPPSAGTELRQYLTVPEVRCNVVRWVADEPQPGLVEAELTDVDGRTWFIDKTAIFRRGVLTPSSSYPVGGTIRCEVLSRSGDAVSIGTARPDGVESEGQSIFRVPPSEMSGD